MLQDNSSSNEIHSDILSSFANPVENKNASNEPLQSQVTNKLPPHIDIGCEPKSSRSKKSDSGCLEGGRPCSLQSPKLILSCSLISVIPRSSMLEEPNPPSYLTLQSSHDTDGGTSMARHLIKVADSGAQDSYKFPSNIYNHNDSFKHNGNTKHDDANDEHMRKRSETPLDDDHQDGNKHIPVNKEEMLVQNPAPANDCRRQQKLDMMSTYKLNWGIPQPCKLVGGGETTLNSNSAGPMSSGSANSSSSSTGAANVPNSNNSNWPAGNGNSASAGRQQVGSASSSNNASLPLNTSQNTGKSANNTGNQNQATGQNQAGNAVATSWAQAAGKNLPPSSSATNTSPASNIATSTTANSSNGTQMSSPNGSSNGSTNSGSNTSKQQMEDFKSIRDSLFATDGWGGQHVNQDSGWDVPSSPEPAVVKDGAAAPTTATIQWKPNVNNGTDLWEANLRNGGQPPPQTAQKAPWGHTPTTNIGGTWGEDDDGESSNVWSGSSGSSVSNNPGVQQWGSTPSNPTPMWGANNKKDDWGNSGSGWNDHREMPRAGNSIDPRSNMVDSSHMRNVMDHRNISSDSMIRGDPRGISGRINGSSSADPMWGGPPPQQPPGPGPHHHVTPTGPPPGPPAQASKMIPPGPAAGHWKEMGGVAGNNLGRGGMQCPPGPTLPQNRMNTSGLNSVAAAAAAAGIKPDQLWTHPNNRNGAWGENGPHDMNSAPWGDEKITPWNEPSGLSSWNSSQKPKTQITPGGWNDGEVDPSSWSHSSKMGPKNLTKEIVWASKQFRILSEMNFKKEDVENALRASNMNLEDALEYLNATRAGSTVNNMDGWRRHDIEASPFDHSSNQPYPSHRFNSQQQLPFAVPPTSRTTQNQPSAHQLRMLVQQIQMAVSAGYLNHQILNQPLAPATLVLLNNLLQQIKTLQQLQQQATQQSMYPGGQPNKSGAFMTLTVKQQQCKQAIQTLQNQIVATQAVYMKQQQQQQQHQPHNLGPVQSQGANMNDFFKTQDPLSLLQANFNDLTLNKDPQMAVNPGFQNQSKLNQWKLPASMDKDDMSGNEFSRAPGTTTKSTPASGSPNLNPLIGQNDSTWSNVSNRCESGWPESVNELTDKDWGSPASAATNFTDLVPEFEPGKPWKGSQMKSVEDDPNITPGSVVRSPLLSISTMKESDIFNNTSNAPTMSGKTSPTLVDMPLTPLTIPPASTWSFNPTSSASSSFASPLGKVNNNGNVANPKTGWADVNAASELWGIPKGRGPPPGLTASKSSNQLVGGAGAASGNNSNGWNSLGSPRWPSMANAQSSPWMGGSLWLLLRNLTPQIDGPTLKTLCFQHGPLENFHLYLNHGIALVKYKSRDEAGKAQGALNSCVLGNTTIFAESPAENEVHALLQQLNQQGTSGNNWSRGGNNAGATNPNNQNKPLQSSANTGSIQTSTDAWSSNTGGGSSQLWPSALWGAPQSGLETPDPHRATPSSLNSFLPGDLLGGESM